MKPKKVEQVLKKFFNQEMGLNFSTEIDGKIVIAEGWANFTVAGISKNLKISTMVSEIGTTICIAVEKAEWSEDMGLVLNDYNAKGHYFIAYQGNNCLRFKHTACCVLDEKDLDEIVGTSIFDFIGEKNREDLTPLWLLLQEGAEEV